MASTNPNKASVLVYGDICSGDYRSLRLIKFLHDSNYCVTQFCPSFYRRNNKLLAILFWIELLSKAAFSDVIYMLPMSSRFIKSAFWATKLFNKKLVVEVYISLYDTIIRDRKSFANDSQQAKAYREQDILALTKADYIIHTSEHELNYWQKILGISIDRSKVFIAPVCNANSLSLSRSFMEDGVLRICWWGTFIPLHGLDNILEAMKLLKQQKVQFTCNLFGVDKPLFNTYAEKIQLAELEDCVFLRKDLSFADSSLLRYLVDNCDLALGIFGNTDKAYHAIPNKLVEALSRGIPTLTMNSPALKEFFNPKTDLWTCEPAPESIAESILNIASGTASPVNWEQTRQKVLKTFSINRYQRVVSEVLGRATAGLLETETSVSSDVPPIPSG